MRGLGLDGRGYLVLAPGARWPAKRWPAAFYGQAAALLAGRTGRVPVLVGDEGEAEAVREAAGACGPAAKVLIGSLPLDELAALLAGAEAMVGNDSGPLHLALAAGTPAVVLFGPTVRAFGFAPLDTARSRILEQALPCRPCTLHGGRRCPLGHHRCLRDTTPETAAGAVLELLAGAAERGSTP